MCRKIHQVSFLINLLIFLIFAHGYYAWRVIPAHEASYARRQKQKVPTAIEEYQTAVEELPDDVFEYYEMNLPKTSLHTVYKFGWCRADVVKPIFLAKTTSYDIPHRFAAATQWIYILDAANIRKFSLQCVVVKVYVPAKYQFKRTRIPFNYCQGNIIYLMMNTVGKMLIHEFYFMAPFNMPAKFVFEYYQPTAE